ncbi:MGC78809 protein, putative [Trichomonas vaginalis G3]|uniref:MGC78809 protein, putative n=1 Tax=Trichomonas vaginalis (strain ATCC PRA-98 / G3) TaxID=412133 RepID=A2EVN9_TRIV3|nr:tRNA binding [Trichomonas vaginalis G3]EAY03249.1 MGC78809 protein, putative [Trichomonas vaginalis G3]KAI5535597.1 tRNA binding [Trichomonas vaginalis G3]|eukprot:XP_001315472.1 MGC78809 protein [Trichomonas vaginalis G3]
MNRYIFHLTLRNENFVISDLIALAQSLNIEMKLEDPTLKIGVPPPSFFIVLLFNTDEDAKLFASKSIVTKACARLYCDGPDFAPILSFAEKFEHQIGDETYSIKVETFGRRISNEDRLNYINQLIPALRLSSNVDLKNPKHTIVVYIRRVPEQKSTITEERYYFGIQLAKGAFEMPDKYSLKTRKFINKTSMESSVAIHACVQGLAGPGKIVYDPFVGSGSLLIAAASLGAYALGSDYDMKSMTQQGPEKKDGVSIPDNFKQYGLLDRFLGIFRLDFLSDNLRYDKMPKLDAIVTDPPYGIREKQRSDAPSPLLPLLLRLYEVAAVCLKVGGRLVYWLPTGYDFDADKDLPKHPALKLVSICQQVLMSRYCRQLVTLEKTHEETAKVEFEIGDQSFLKVRALVFSKRSNPEGFQRKENARDRKRAKKEARKQRALEEKQKEQEIQQEQEPQKE